MGIEPTTPSLRVKCSTIEPRKHIIVTMYNIQKLHYRISYPKFKKNSTIFYLNFHILTYVSFTNYLLICYFLLFTNLEVNKKVVAILKKYDIVVIVIKKDKCTQRADTICRAS